MPSLFFISTAFAGFPEKPITIVVHSKPGSGIDIASRLISNIAKKYTDMVFIENKFPSAGRNRNRGLVESQHDIVHFVDGEIGVKTAVSGLPDDDFWCDNLFGAGGMERTFF